MSASSPSNSSDIVQSYLTGNSTLDDAASSYGDVKGIVDKTEQIVAFVNEVLSHPISDPSQFPKLADLEDRVHQLSPSSAYKIYETSIGLLLGDNRALINELNKSAEDHGIIGHHPYWDKLCMWFGELISTYITNEKHPYLAAMLHTMNDTINYYIRKEKQPEIDQKTKNQHIVIQYLNLLSPDQRKNPEMIRYIFTLVHRPAATLFLQEIVKLPKELVLLDFGTAGRISNYIDCADLLKEANDDDHKQCILIAARLLPEFITRSGSDDSIRQTAGHLKKFSGENRKTIIRTIEAFEAERLNLSNILNTKIDLAEQKDVDVIDLKQTTTSTSSRLSGAAKILEIGVSTLTQFGLSIGARFFGSVAGSESPPPSPPPSPYGEDGREEVVSNKSSPSSQTPEVAIQPEQVREPKEVMEHYFGNISSNPGICKGFSEFIEAMPPLPAGTKVEQSTDGNTLTITLTQEMRSTLKLDPEKTKMDRDQYNKLNRLDLAPYQGVRNDFVVNEAAQAKPEKEKYTSDDLQYFGTIGKLATKQLKGGQKVKIGPVITFAKNGDELQITGVQVAAGFGFWKSISTATLKIGPNNEPYIEVPALIPGMKNECYFLEDLKTLMQFAFPKT